MTIMVLIVVLIMSGGKQYAYAEIAADLDSCLARGAEIRAANSIPGTLFMGTACEELDLPHEAFSNNGVME